ncbi:hypothetical protein GOZ90_14300 [Agrobacterium vitis]|uniref:Uncharacterized protein n=1 Tax=Agrobacterium vitis TaxID=373 RepID=A0A6L6VG61_AGRVI|nr:hypothetical protein [Agrobacterium vitis]MUZ73855.1 hypothetical protein [Agrobacterium vitis]MVA54489.1 hypothetical protein [Agrobacterium vitis]
MFIAIDDKQLDWKKGREPPGRTKTMATILCRRMCRKRSDIAEAPAAAARGARTTGWLEDGAVNRLFQGMRSAISWNF